ncbi:hypothetical protein [Bartonella koehlerae]|uniref:hypothetical protein n=1 Tax=Bartonella koehlerae TaxID=92181 RepID=UPI00315A26D2
MNRVSAEHLQEIADRLNVTVFFFYADISTKADILYHDNDKVSNKVEHFLLKNFRGLNSKKTNGNLAVDF